jgi:hypothetical protein
MTNRSTYCLVKPNKKDYLLQDTFGSDFTAVRKDTTQRSDTAAVSFAGCFYGDQSKDDKKDGVWNKKEKIQKLKH